MSSPGTCTRSSNLRTLDRGSGCRGVKSMNDERPSCESSQAAWRGGVRGEYDRPADEGEDTLSLSEKRDEPVSSPPASGCSRFSVRDADRGGSPRRSSTWCPGRSKSNLGSSASDGGRPMPLPLPLLSAASGGLGLRSMTNGSPSPLADEDDPLLDGADVDALESETWEGWESFDGAIGITTAVPCLSSPLFTDAMASLGAGGFRSCFRLCRSGFSLATLGA